MNKSDTRAFINQLLVYTLVMICFSGSIGLATVWMRHQISVTANATRKLEAQIVDVERRLADTAIQVTAEQSPEALARRNLHWRLGMTAPADTQVVWVAGSPEERLLRLRNEGLFRSDTLPPALLKNVRAGLDRN